MAMIARMHPALRTASLLSTVFLASALAAQASRPNVVVILADDMGYGDVRALNPDSKIPTPHLDALAGSGMSFTDAHTPSAVCTPTRYGLLTGRYCWRGRLERGVLNGYGARLIEPGRRTLGDLMQGAGYHTGIVGKWHLGLAFSKTGAGPSAIDFEQPIGDGPNVFGFDYSHIIPASLDFPPYVYIENGRVTAPETVAQKGQPFPAFLRAGPRAPDFVMTEALDHLTERAVGFIAAQSKAEAPFLLYFPLTAPHKPTLPHPRFVGTTGLGPYGDFVAQVDATVGTVLQALDDAGVADDTLVIYTSDNGSYMYRYDDPAHRDHVDDHAVQGFRAEHHRANGPWRGTKADVWEAGHRVPFLVRWPGQVAPGSSSTRTICLTDVLATCAELTGGDLAADMGEDSFSFLATLQGKTGNTRAPVIHHSANGTFAIRDGRWKLVAGNGSGGRQQPRGKPFARPWQLFDLDSDPAEAHDVIAGHPEVAQRLERQLQRLREAGRSR